MALVGGQRAQCHSDRATDEFRLHIHMGHTGEVVTDTLNNL
jgi:hypothetical protein